MSVFKSSWARTWADLGLLPQAGLFEELLGAYQESQRHYHSQQHLAECLMLFEQSRHLAEYPGEVAIALWFHDAIYDVRGKSNERQSADWAVRVLTASNATKEALERVDHLIMATQHDSIPARCDEQLIVDIDLSILGADPQRFAEYDRQVRAEYSWVPSFVYNMKRKELLRSFLDRTDIYNTTYFRDRYEVKARVNLAAIS